MATLTETLSTLSLGDITNVASLGLAAAALVYAMKAHKTSQEQMAKASDAEQRAHETSIHQAFTPFISIATELIKECKVEADCLVDDDARFNRFGGIDFPDLEVLPRLLDELKRVIKEPLADQEAIQKAVILVGASSMMVHTLLTLRKEVWSRTESIPSDMRNMDRAYALQNMPAAEYALAELVARRDVLLTNITMAHR